MEMIGAGIVTFNPDIVRLKKNICAIIGQIDELVIIDNASENIDEIIFVINEFDKIKFIRNTSNYGIARALNIVCEYFKEKEYEWVLTLDQDSICPQNMVDVYKKYISGELGILCPRIYDMNLENNIVSKTEKLFVRRCITSGSLTNIKAWNEIHGFDERMFIDGVDFDFCDRLYKNGYKILQINFIEMKHEIGCIQERNFLFFKVKVKNHPAFRKFFIAKNLVYLDRKNKCATYPISTVLREFKLVFIVLLYEEDKVHKVVQILKGMLEGFKEKLDCTV